MLTACTLPRQSVSPGSKITREGYSIIVPDGQGWSVTEDKDNRITLMRLGNSKGESFLIRAFLVPLFTGIGTEKDFLEYISTQRNKEKVDTSRFKILENNEKLWQEKGNGIVRCHAKMEDSGGPLKSAGISPLILEEESYVCRHFDNKNIAVFFVYSRRISRKYWKENISELADNFFGQVKVEPLKYDELISYGK
jgi:hypothetical protein